MDLKPIELEMIALIAAGMTTRQTAKITKYTRNTVDTMIDRILAKTGAKNRPSLIAFAYQTGILKKIEPVNIEEGVPMKIV